MFTFNAKIFNFNIQDDDTYLYLFKAEWRKKFMDTSNHNYGGFTSLLKTESGKVINTGNYSVQNPALAALDPQLTSLLGTFVESHYISILPECEIGEHYDIYDPDDETVNVTDRDFINTSILYPVHGEVIVNSNGYKTVLQPGVFTVIDTSKLHNGVNLSKNVVWCSSSLVYGKSYNDVKHILREYIVDDYDEIGE